MVTKEWNGKLGRGRQGVPTMWSQTWCLLFTKGVVLPPSSPPSVTLDQQQRHPDLLEVDPRPLEPAVGMAQTLGFTEPSVWVWCLPNSKRHSSYHSLYFCACLKMFGKKKEEEEECKSQPTWLILPVITPHDSPMSSSAPDQSDAAYVFRALGMTVMCSQKGELLLPWAMFLKSRSWSIGGWWNQFDRPCASAIFIINIFKQIQNQRQ